MRNRISRVLLSMFLAGGLIVPAMSQEPASAAATDPASGTGTPGTYMLDMQEAIDHAIAYNKSLKNARMEVERSDASLWESIAQGLPQVEGSMDYMTYFNYEMAFSFGMGEAPSFTTDEYQSAFDQTQAAFPFYTQNDLGVHGANSYYDGVLQSMLPPNTILLSDQSTAKLQVSQLIFSGQFIIGIQTAKLAKLISEQNYEFSELGIKESVITSYYLVLITEESLRILEQNVQNLEETLQQTEIMFRTGMAEQTDVDQIRITVNQLQNSMNSLNRNLELNYNLFRFQLGLETNAVVQLTDNLEALFISEEPEVALSSAFILEDNVTYQLMKTQEEINEKLVSLEKWNYAPTLAGFYNYNAKILTTDFDMNPNHLMGLTMSVPIFSSGMRKARVDQARINYNMAQNNMSIMEDQLNLQEKQFRYNLESSLENYQTQKENVEVAMRVYDSFRRKFEQGMATSLDLTQANSNYLEAESNYMTSMMEVLNAKLQLDKMMNNL
ncbi:MAG: TolC family protein [Bacteroidetes bacterium]|nr:TolC family protein [Bacteroidota bacterium]